ncbi:MAG: polyprenyl synthetase family protein [Bacteroidales bacterium]|nr:polyprenyl synthetase family protein [Bacteroidales bacterium]
MNLEAWLDDVRAEYLRRMTQGDNALLRQVEQYTASHSGKMLRPRMLLAAAATQGEACLHSRRTLLLAVCVEMLHNASLLHDDVIDHAASRRGQPSVNTRWNNAVAVLVGDYHLTQIMALLNEVDDRDITCKVNDTVRSMVEAELLQQQVGNCQLSSTNCLLKPANLTSELSTYLNIIDGKTANLFALAAEMGNPAYRDFGLHYGRLFQLRDDIADGDDTPWTAQLIEEEERAIKQLGNILNI